MGADHEVVCTSTYQVLVCTGIHQCGFGMYWYIPRLGIHRYILGVVRTGTYQFLVYTGVYRLLVYTGTWECEGISRVSGVSGES